ncbi:ABC transporter ATP-binding protein [Helicobacter cetorum]|uniref:ABC transporter ATP-binding protein n=1 Tax=Helicobacter cetorum (strain ATCC BAA-540 / CCUG 52418 / MIT 99-5656) TaxID=1163745 RepID=I0ESS1_HELCM|nr:ATP-binding cassette domain-containing protein [Helicobacter cetorum]AFI05990.1 ABC transporter ATP-binding protein [Helicobacter cetorum MIT 99-5656]
MSEILIEVKNIHNAFGSTIIHRGVSFNVYKGEVVAILGGSGSGKSTLLRSMILLNRPIKGEVLLFGEDIWKLKDEEQRKIFNRCGICFQFGALYSSLTVLENVGIMLEKYSPYSKNIIEEISKMWIEKVGLPTRAYHLYPYELSGGMKKRVGLARAMATNPEILFLDEPTSGLDPYSAGKFDELIMMLKESLQLTVVMITHDLDTVHDCVDRFIMLKDGLLEFNGNLEEFVKKAQSEGLDEGNLFNSTRGEKFWKDM